MKGMKVMAFWNKEKTEKPPAPLPRWEEARLLTDEEQKNFSALPAGWYLYKRGGRWNTLKPDETNGGFDRGYDFQSVLQTQKWLGIPVPPALIVEEAKEKEEEERKSERVREQIAQAMAKARGEEPKTPEEEEEEEPKQKGPNRRRNREIHVRFTEEEYQKFLTRCEAAGMSGAVCLRYLAVNGRISVDPRQKDMDEKLLAIHTALHELKAEIGRIGGMLKMVIKPNEGQRELKPEEWADLIQAIRDVGSMKKQVGKAMERINGNFKA